jgi:uncharacterized membrane protein YkoI
MAALILSTASAKPVKFSELPVPAQKAVTNQMSGGNLQDIEQTNDDEEMTFDVSFTTKAGEEQDFIVAEDGTVLSIEVELTETPAAVQKTIHAQADGWTLESIDKNVADAEVSYDVTVSKAGREKIFTVALDGSLLSTIISLAEAPVPVQTAIKLQLADGSLKSIEENFDADGNSFDVEISTVEGRRKSFSLTANGDLASEETSLEKISPAARKTIQEKIGAGKILRIDKSLIEKKGGVLPFEVEGRKDGKPFNFSVGPRGRFLGMDD